MSNGQALTNLIIILVVFYFAAFFVAAEFAIVSVRKSALESALEAGEGNRRKLKLALNMVSNMNEYLSTTQVGVTTTGIILGWLGADTLATLLTDLLGFMPLNKTSIVAISAVLGVVILTYLEVVITEIVPKNISIDMPMKVMMFIVTPLHYFHVVFYPFVWLLNVSASGIVKLVGLKPAGEEEDVLSQNEILNISKNAVHGGAIDKDDFVYMQRAFDFNDKVAKDIMIDRTSLEVVDVTDTVRGVINKYLQKKFTRFPVVANNDKDKILGYVYIYDMIRQAQVDDSVRVSKVMRTIITVPEVTPIQKLLQSMVQKQTPIVVVLDEYGGTSGIVTDRDIYEELFGTVKDEADDVSLEDIIDNGDGTYKVSGKTTLYDFERYFKFRDKDFQESESVTIAGYLLENYKIKLGLVITIGQFDIKITEFNRNYIEWLEVSHHQEEKD
ncbi:hemolysin family protein [Ligilactobacillus ruminis]|uniref:Magnesium and cobalt efflux protein CorC n=2 Tax=Ligilactobacillus ruminis TaxID=1623 RepID=A0A837ISU1_9LACO|nr:hemolysin family protein [Ligilactobacillus ruminis]MCR5748863.1 hemolysin family protein [Lactobacillus sp.]KLA46941.1 magnesium and cobalt efflux protein CorC [Ligilactobacillus ruminis]KRM82156.1 magnesium and cobalt efflux protein CorC [Ligilactobacillus ruminis DSM 20403 = NBRC 102161]MCF2545409.1 HlyC/CorC family transporter [Ligilactobacillus ruminis]SFG54692.1 Hemolysin, contains CBS domains [Ligilactobacillus ruminis DSM 20403 = NBRC 102161]